MIRWGGKTLAAVAVTVAVTVLPGCGSSDTSAFVVPVSLAHSRDLKTCADLQKLLPDTLDAVGRRRVRPESPTTAAWGDPAIVLRCGVAEPAILAPGSPEYDPTGAKSDWEEIDGLCWVSVGTHRAGDTSEPFTFVTAKQDTYVELDVPAEYSGEESPQAVLSRLILEVDATVPDRRFLCA